MTVSLAHGYAVCQRIARQSGSSFYFSLCLLPREKRRAMYALYAFARTSDDLADQGPVGLRAQRLATWSQQLEEALNGSGDEPILRALCDAVQRFQIPPEYLRAIIQGVQLDLACRQPETFAELEEYCYHVAGAVGLACLHIWGFRSPSAIPLGKYCGQAIQLTNILRDLAADAATGRFYVPREDCRRFGVENHDFLMCPVPHPVSELFRFEVQRTESLFAKARPLSKLLNSDGKRAFTAIYATYYELLQRISTAGVTPAAAPVRIPWPRRAMIAARSLFVNSNEPHRANFP